MSDGSSASTRWVIDSNIASKPISEARKIPLLRLNRIVVIVLRFLDSYYQDQHRTHPTEGPGLWGGTEYKH